MNETAGGFPVRITVRAEMSDGSVHEYQVDNLAALAGTEPRSTPFDHERYRARALEIHAATCGAPGWCNYGKPEPAELADDESMPWPERQRRAAERLEGTRHCMAAVEAENRAGDENL